MKRKLTKPMEKQTYTIKDAERRCGHLEDYTGSWEYRLAEHAKVELCTVCRKAEREEREAHAKEMTERANKWLLAHNIDPKTATIDTQSNDCVGITLWIDLPE